MRERDVQTIEATGEAERAWVDHVHALANKTLMPAANTWYNGANVPGKARDFMVYVGGVSRYRRRCDQVASSGYEGFDFDKRTSVNDLEHAG
jgi:cyclohexanone monooxygenase